MQTPEQKARLVIDSLLEQAGWKIQNMADFNPHATLGVAVREFLTKDGGRADYALFIDGYAVGLIEAKAEGALLNPVQSQSGRYADKGFKWFGGEKIRFLYETTGTITHFTDCADPHPRAREVFAIHQPKTLQFLLSRQETLRQRLQSMPDLDSTRLRECQTSAINNLEKSFKENRPRALVQMATGAGKTYTAITSVYRLLKPPVNAKKILFLVDTKNLGEQAETEFRNYEPVDSKYKFGQLYNVQRLNSGFIDPAAHVCICTIQRMYSILRGEELEEEWENISAFETPQKETPKEVAYNPAVPFEMFDFIIVDECHRSIYNLWRQVLEYFDSFLIGLTATPAAHTIGFFNQNMVSSYTHEEAVRDHVNVGYKIYNIRTEITGKGAKLKAEPGFQHEFRSKTSRKKTYEQLENDLDYLPSQLDRSVVNKSQIRTVIREFKKALPVLFPERKEVPKTLVFAKNNQHAEDIIDIITEEFAEDNRFCKKITYNSENPQSLLKSFRREYNPRIAVTVDMIATGTDVKPLECLLFMRDVKSENYFIQMIGRGTRTCSEDEMRQVTSDIQGEKEGFIVVDAVGVFDSKKTNPLPVERKPQLSTEDLILSVASHKTTDEDTLMTLAGRLTRLDASLGKKEQAQITEATGGISLHEIVTGLMTAHDPDLHEAKARELLQIPDHSAPEEKQLEEAKKKMISETVKHLYPVRTLLIQFKQEKKQLMDTQNLDATLESNWREQSKQDAENLIGDFKIFIETHRDKITALQLFYAEPYRRRTLTVEMMEELRKQMLLYKPPLLPAALWHAYAKLEQSQQQCPPNQLSALIALLRRTMGLDTTLTPFENTVNLRFRDWVMQQNAGPVHFNEAQMQWLRNMRDLIASSFHLDDNLISLQYGDSGLADCYDCFDNKPEEVMWELSERLVG